MLHKLGRLSPLRKLEQHRLQMHEHHLPLPAFVQAILETPLPQADFDVRQQPLLSLDIETSGLDAEHDHIVSIGWVPIVNQVIRLAEARYFLITPSGQDDPQQVVLHHIMPQIQRQGIPLAQAIELLFTQLKGKVLLAHGSVVERQFIHHFMQQHGWPDLPIVWLDTLKIEQAYAQYAPYNMPHSNANDWRLSTVRKRYHLPAYQAHHALSDAIATAELYLAQQNRLFAKAYVPLELLMKASV